MSGTGDDDLYGVLGVKPDASTDEIRRAYVDLARRLHPDFHGDADAATRASLQRRMQTVNRAWAVLGHASRRRDYNRGVRTGAAGPAPSRRRPASPRPDPFDDVYSSVRSTEEIGLGPTDPIRARLVAVMVLALAAAALAGLAWVIVGWMGFGAILFLFLATALGAFAAIPVTAVWRSYRADQGR